MNTFSRRVDNASHNFKQLRSANKVAANKGKPNKQKGKKKK